MPPQKRNTSFQANHAAEFGLRICQRATGSSTAVVAVACRFCEVFGKEEPSVGMKRSRSQGVKFFKAPFRKENYSSYHTRMHPVKWSEYRELDRSAKELVFDIGGGTGHAFLGSRALPTRMFINRTIVDVIISDMMFHPEDMAEVSRARLFESFDRSVDPDDSEQSFPNAGRYNIIIRNTKQFKLVCRYLASGLSFRQIVQVISDTKELLGIATIGSCSEGTVSRYDRFICAINIQRIANLLQKCWAFSVALDMATHLATAYCNSQVRVCHNSTVHDFHLISVPVHERHTGESILNTFEKAMDAIFAKAMDAIVPDWQKTIVGASSDGEKKMTGCHQGVITRIQRVARSGFMRVWCGAHQLDLCMQSFYLAIPDSFYSTLTSLVAFLRRQQTFTANERSQCPLILDTLWLSMIKVTSWMDTHRLAVRTVLDEKKPSCTPPDSWWILMLLVHEIAGLAAISCKSLQGRSELLCNQHHTLQRLVFELKTKFGVDGSLSLDQRTSIDEALQYGYCLRVL